MDLGGGEALDHSLHFLAGGDRNLLRLRTIFIAIVSNFEYISSILT